MIETPQGKTLEAIVNDLAPPNDAATWEGLAADPTTRPLAGDEPAAQAGQGKTELPTAPDLAPRRMTFGQAVLAVLRDLLPGRGHERRRLTPGEKREAQAEAMARETQRQQKAQLAWEAEKYAALIRQTLTRLDICYRYKRNERDFLTSRVKEITFRRPIVLRPEAIYLEVDLRPRYAPRGVGVAQLLHPDTLENLSAACAVKVSARYKPDTGFWYIVERELGVRGIPFHVKHDDMLAARPASADGLHIPIGVGENKKHVWRSLAQMQSMLVAGTTGGGKSNWLNEAICTLIRFNSPRRLRLVLFDLKGGVEFGYYEHIPHLLPVPTGEDSKTAAIIDRREQVGPALRWIVAEGERRLALLREKHVKDIGQLNYNYRTSPLAHVVVVVDEWADVKLDGKIGREAEELLINIASRFRAAGIHVILCTQVPNRDVVSIRVKNVLPARLAFACPNGPSSMLIVNNYKAVGLEPRGRAIFDWGHSQLELQTPFISPETVDNTVTQAIKGQWEEHGPAAHDVSDMEIIHWAVTENAGHLGWRDVWIHFRARGITQEYAKAICASLEGEVRIVGGTPYKVMAASGRMGRRLLPLEDEPGHEPAPGADGQAQAAGLLLLEPEGKAPPGPSADLAPEAAQGKTLPAPGADLAQDEPQAAQDAPSGPGVADETPNAAQAAHEPATAQDEGNPAPVAKRGRGRPRKHPEQPPQPARGRPVRVFNKFVSRATLGLAPDEPLPDMAELERRYLAAQASGNGHEPQGKIEGDQNDPAPSYPGQDEAGPGSNGNTGRPRRRDRKSPDPLARL